VRAALDDHIVHRTVMALPIVDEAVYSSTQGAFHLNRIGGFLLHGYDLNNYLDLVYLGDAAPIYCDSNATATPTSSLTVTPSFFTVTPTQTPTGTPTQQAMTLTIANLYFAPAQGQNVRPISIKAHVTRNGIAFDGAFVNGTVDRGTGPLAITLSSIGNGNYTVCNTGNWTGTGASPDLSLTATDGAGNSASASSASPSPVKFPECP
jgi:hypothetical protein